MTALRSKKMYFSLIVFFKSEPIVDEIRVTKRYAAISCCSDYLEIIEGFVGLLESQSLVKVLVIPQQSVKISAHCSAIS